jgi:hypothetical protein
MSGITWLFNTPFYTGISDSAESVPDPFPVSIGGHRYAIDWALFQRTTISPFREARDSAALPGEASLNPAAAWKRNRDDWSLGAGQLWADRSPNEFNSRVELEPRQYRYSKGVDPWTVGQLQCLPATRIAVASANTNLEMVPLGGYVYWSDGANIKRSNDLEATTPTIANVTGLAGTIVDLTTDGEVIYVATSAGIYSVAGTVATIVPGAGGALVVESIEWANGWLFVGDAEILKEVRASGTVNNVFTHRNSAFRWAAIAGSPSYIYAGGQATDLTEIYKISVDDTGALTVPVYAGSLPRGESLRDLAYYGGFMVIGTSKGIRVAQIQSDGSLVIGPLIVENGGVVSVFAEAQFVWFTWSQYDSFSTGLGRLDLSRFSDTGSLVPAYASDLMYDSAANVLSVIRWEGQTYFSVSGVGIIQYDGDGLANGEISFGRFRWGTYEPKVFLGMEVITELLAAASVKMYLDLPNGDRVSVGQRLLDNQTGMGLLFGLESLNESHDWFEPVLELLPFGLLSPGNVGPIVERVTLRALPNPKVVEQISLPIILHSVVNLEAGEGQEQVYDVQAEAEFLRDLVRLGQPVHCQIGRESFKVIVREAGWIDNTVTGLAHDRKAPEGRMMLTLVTAEV